MPSGRGENEGKQHGMRVQAFSPGAGATGSPGAASSGGDTPSGAEGNGQGPVGNSGHAGGLRQNEAVSGEDVQPGSLDGLANVRVQQGVLPPPPGQRRYYKYHMQRLQTTANHVLFYVVDADDNAHLAIVGTDVRLSGHFVYCTLPDFHEAPPIRCTNRVKVMEWLTALGATDAADPDRVKVPSISRQQLEMLLNSDPMFSKPKMDREYSSWREEGGRLPDGRHYKNYYLVDDATRYERLVITAEDSHRRDRRYNYKAVPDIGGFAFENGQAVKEWLDFVVGRPPAPHVPRPLPPKAAARAAAVQATGIASPQGYVVGGRTALPRGLAGRNMSMSESQANVGGSGLSRPGSGGTNGNNANGNGFSGIDALLGASAMSGGPGGGFGGDMGGGPTGGMGSNTAYFSGLRHMDSALSPGAASESGGARGAGNLPGTVAQQGGLPAAFYSHSAPTVQAGIGLGTWQGWNQSNSLTGYDDGGDNVDVRPTKRSNVHGSRGPSASASQAALMGAGMVGAGGMDDMEVDAHMDPMRNTRSSTSALMGANGGALAGAGGSGGALGLGMGTTDLGGLGGAASMPGGLGALSASSLGVTTGADVVGAFQGDALLMQWVTGVPDEVTIAKFVLWGQKLRAAAALAGRVTAADHAILPPAVQAQEKANAVQGAAEALLILREMETIPVSLRLLEMTQISWAVSGLRTHPDPAVAAQATRLTTIWRETATAALSRATTALHTSPAPTTALVTAGTPLVLAAPPATAAATAPATTAPAPTAYAQVQGPNGTQILVPITMTGAAPAGAATTMLPITLPNGTIALANMIPASGTGASGQTVQVTSASGATSFPPGTTVVSAAPAPGAAYGGSLPGAGGSESSTLSMRSIPNLGSLALNSSSGQHPLPAGVAALAIGSNQNLTALQGGGGARASSGVLPPGAVLAAVPGQQTVMSVLTQQPGMMMAAAPAAGAGAGNLSAMAGNSASGGN